MKTHITNEIATQTLRRPVMVVNILRSMLGGQSMRSKRVKVDAKPLVVVMEEQNSAPMRGATTILASTSL